MHSHKLLAKLELARSRGYQLAAQTTRDGYPILYQSQVIHGQAVVSAAFVLTEDWDGTPCGEHFDVDWDSGADWHIPPLVEEAVACLAARNARPAPAEPRALHTPCNGCDRAAPATQEQNQLGWNLPP
jgi:hypothetical protein